MIKTQAGAAPAPRAVSGDGWMRRTGRAVLRPFLPVGGVEVAIEVGSRLQRSAATGRRLLVEDLDSGTDTAVVTALMARALAHYRRDRVLAVSSSRREPSLATRFGVEGPGELGPRLDTTSFESAGDSIGRVGDRLWTVRADPDDADAHTAGLLPLSRFFGVTLVEGESGSPFMTSARTDAHARVLVARATRDATREVGRVLDRAEGDDALARTVVVLTEELPREDRGFDGVRTAQVIADSGAAVLRLEHDRHVAQGSVVRPRHIREVTHRTVLAVAAEALVRAIDGGAHRDGRGR